MSMQMRDIELLLAGLQRAPSYDTRGRRDTDRRALCRDNLHRRLTMYALERIVAQKSKSQGGTMRRAAYLRRKYTHLRRKYNMVIPNHVT